MDGILLFSKLNLHLFSSSVLAFQISCAAKMTIHNVMTRAILITMVCALGNAATLQQGYAWIRAVKANNTQSCKKNDGQ
jgi:hypothetical protein